MHLYLTFYLTFVPSFATDTGNYDAGFIYLSTVDTFRGQTPLEKFSAIEPPLSVQPGGVDV